MGVVILQRMSGAGDLDEDDFLELSNAGNATQDHDDMLRRAAASEEDPVEKARMEKFLQKKQAVKASKMDTSKSGKVSAPANPDPSSTIAKQKELAQSGAVSAEDLKQQHLREKEAGVAKAAGQAASQADKQNRSAADQAALDASRKAANGQWDDDDDMGGLKKSAASSVSGLSATDTMWVKKDPRLEAKAKAEADAAAADAAADAAVLQKATADANQAAASAASAGKKKQDSEAVMACMSPTQAYEYGMRMANGDTENSAALDSERKQRETQLAAGMDTYEDQLDSQGGSPSRKPAIHAKGSDISGRSASDSMWVGKPPPPKPAPSGVIPDRSGAASAAAGMSANDLAYQQGMALASGEPAAAAVSASVDPMAAAYEAGMKQAAQGSASASVTAPSASASVTAPSASASVTAPSASASVTAPVSPTPVAALGQTVASPSHDVCRQTMDLEVQRQTQLVTSLQAENQKMKDLNKAAELRASQAEAKLQGLVEQTQGRRLAPMNQSAGAATASVSTPGKQSQSAGQPSGAIQTDFKSKISLNNDSAELERVSAELELALNRAAVAETNLDEQQHQLAQMRLSLGKELKSKGQMVGSDRAEWEHAVTQTIIEQQKHANRMIQKYVSKEENSTLELDALKAKVTALVQQNTDFLHEINELRAANNPVAEPLQSRHSQFGGSTTPSEADRKAPAVRTPIALQAQGMAEDTYSNAVYEDVLNKSRLERLLANAQYTTELNKAQFEANEVLQKQAAEPTLTHPLQNTRFALAKEKSRALASSLKRELFEVS